MSNKELKGKYKIAIAGAGYVGLAVGVSFAAKGHNVIGIDIDSNKIELAKKGISPIYEKNIEELIKASKEKGNLNYTTDYKSAYKDADFIFICVVTPPKENGSVNLEYVYNCVNQISESVERDCIVFIKSTVSIGTNDEIEKIFKEKLKDNINIEVVSNPEFLSQGTAIHDMMNPSRIVIGTNSQEKNKVIEDLYKDFNAPILFTDRKSAEMIKYASNSFLALKISYINEIANLCEKVGADIKDVVKGMSYDKRIGDKFLGFGARIWWQLSS